MSTKKASAQAQWRAALHRQPPKPRTVGIPPSIRMFVRLVTRHNGKVGFTYMSGPEPMYFEPEQVIEYVLLLQTYGRSGPTKDLLRSVATTTHVTIRKLEFSRMEDRNPRYNHRGTRIRKRFSTRVVILYLGVGKAETLPAEPTTNPEDGEDEPTLH